MRKTELGEVRAHDLDHVLFDHVICLGGRCERGVMLLKKLKYQAGQMVVDLDALIEVVDVETQRVGKVLFQGEQVE